jgi:hypothetical protein
MFFSAEENSGDKDDLIEEMNSDDIFSDITISCVEKLKETVQTIKLLKVSFNRTYLTHCKTLETTRS